MRGILMSIFKTSGRKMRDPGNKVAIFTEKISSFNQCVLASRAHEYRLLGVSCFT